MMTIFKQMLRTKNQMMTIFKSLKSIASYFLCTAFYFLLIETF